MQIQQESSSLACEECYWTTDMHTYHEKEGQKRLADLLLQVAEDTGDALQQEEERWVE